MVYSRGSHHVFAGWFEIALKAQLQNCHIVDIRSVRACYAEMQTPIVMMSLNSQYQVPGHIVHCMSYWN